MVIRNLTLMAGILLLSAGCASVTKGGSAVTQVQIDNCSEVIQCEASNKKGSWPFQAPGPAKFKKSDKGTVLACQDGPGRLSVTMAPTKSAMVWGNVLVGGVIGGGVDAVTDAHWEYPESISMHRKYCNGVSVEPSGAAQGASVSGGSAAPGSPGQVSMESQ